jgi:hypothetical protein
MIVEDGHAGDQLGRSSGVKHGYRAEP